MDPGDDPLDDILTDLEAHSILLAAANHDLDSLKNLLRSGSANVQDPETGFTPLHAAIGALADDGTDDKVDHDRLRSEQDQDQAEATIRLLLENGAIWNELDAANETPGCMAWRLGLTKLYDVLVEAGVRAEILLNRLDAFAPLDDTSDSDGEHENVKTESEDTGHANASETIAGGFRIESTARHSSQEGELKTEQEDSERLDSAAKQGALMSAQQVAASLISCNKGDSLVEEKKAAETRLDQEVNLSNTAFLESQLTVNPDRILDADASGVMMSWETALMEQTADMILPTSGLKVLNIGHGMGIIDGFLAAKGPSQHDIVEAHSDVVEKMQLPTTGFLARHTAANLLQGTWQQILPKLVDSGQMYDAIFFDTYAEDYAAFREFLSEYATTLLNPHGKWSFFNGLGADRRICYDVYTRIVELDLEESGFDVAWTKVSVPNLQQEFQDLKRSYFALDEYRLPICQFAT